MKKIILILISICCYLNCTAQKYEAKDFIGYTNYINISSVNVRFYDLLFEYPINQDKTWISKNKIKKISYLFNGKVFQSQNYFEDGSIAKSEFDSGSSYVYTKNGKDILITEYHNKKEFSTTLEKFSNDGKMIERKSQFSNGQKNAKILKIFYIDDKVVKTEQYFNDKIEYKNEFTFSADLLKNIIKTDYKVEVQPKQTRENENVTLKYDDNNNCVEIVNVKYFGQLKNTHLFKYNAKNNLVEENYALNEGKNSTKEIGIIKYEYDNENRISEIIEEQEGKGSIININYALNKKIEKLVISSSTKAFSSYLPFSFYVGKNKKVFDFSYDNKNNLIEIKEFFNGDLDNSKQFLIEYYK